ncbi:MAG: hypothetical protein CMG35_11230 [Candidatus Marinimicrobia bacterium]|nr:hypothetical protein [Candidatus Neomarinimicrobiota bacterium]|tara:strand:- start:3499 stop:6105 length:2607 start_codon:yes stop_codon:yes gene_type:complete
MALKRETRNVSIGNMPIVQPASQDALANFARRAQQDFVQEKELEKRDNDAMYVSKQKSALFDRITQIKLSQEIPDPTAFAKEIGTHVRTTLRNAENDEQRVQMQLAYDPIISATMNDLAEKRAIYNSDVTLSEIDDSTQQLVDEFDVLGENAQRLILKNGTMDGEIDQWFDQKVRKSLGRYSPAQAKIDAREVKTQLRTKLAFNEYMTTLQTLGKTAADEQLAKTAADWSKTAKGEHNFRQDVRMQLSSLNVQNKIKKLYNTALNKFTEASHNERKMMLSSLEGKIPEDMMQQLRETVETGNKVIASADYAAVVGLELESALTEKDINDTASKLSLYAKTPKDRATLARLVGQAKQNIIRDKVKEQADEAKDANKRLDESGLADVLDVIKLNGVPTDPKVLGSITSHYPDGRPITNPSHIKAIRNAIRTANTEGKALRDWVSAGRPGTPNATIVAGLEKDFGKKAGAAWQAYLSGDNTPGVVEAIGGWMTTNKYMPKQIADHYKFADISKAPTAQVQQLSRFYEFVRSNLEPTQNITKVMANIDPTTKIMLSRFALIKPEEQASWLANWQQELALAQNNPEKTRQAILAQKITKPAKDGEPHMIEQGVVDYVQTSKMFDWGKMVLNTKAVAVEGYFDTWQHRNKITPFLDEARSFDKNSLLGYLFGKGIGDQPFYISPSAVKEISNGAAADFVQHSGIGSEREFVEGGIEKVAHNIGYSNFLRPESMFASEDDHYRTIQVFSPEQTYPDITPDRMAAIYTELAGAAYDLNPNVEEMLNFPPTSQYRQADGKLNFGELFDDGRLMLASPLKLSNGDVLYKIIVKGDDGRWKTIPNYSSANVPSSDYFNINNVKLLENRTRHTKIFGDLD